MVKTKMYLINTYNPKGVKMKKLQFLEIIKGISFIFNQVVQKSKINLLVYKSLLLLVDEKSS